MGLEKAVGYTPPVDQQEDTTVEQQRIPETGEQRRKRELNEVGSIVMHRKLDEVKPEHASGSRGEQGLYLLNILRSAKGDFASPITLEADKPEDKPLEVTIDGKSVKISMLQGINGDKANCVVHVDGAREGTQMDVDVRTVTMGFIQAEWDSLKDKFDPAEQALIETQLKIFAGDATQLEDGNADAIRNTIEKAAASAGVLTAKDVASFIEKTSAHIQPDPEGKYTKEEEAKLLQKQDALKLLQGKTIMDAETTMGVLKTLGTEKELGLQQHAINKHIEALEKKKDESELNTEEEESLAKLKDASIALKQAHKMLGEQGQLQEFFTEMQKGKIDKDVAKQVVEGFKSGNIDTIVSNALTALEDKDGDSEATKAAKAKAREEIKKRQSLGEYVKKGGIGLALLVALMTVGGAVVASKAFMSTTKSLS